MKVTLTDESRQLDVEIRCRDWNVAGVVAACNETNPPEGYKLLSAITKSRRRTGRRANLSMRFVWRPQDPDLDTPSKDDLYEIFMKDARFAAQGDEGSEDARKTGGAPYPD